MMVLADCDNAWTEWLRDYSVWLFILAFLLISAIAKIGNDRR